MSISEPDKISNLWKKSREVNDIYKTERYNSIYQTPYKENVFNESIFSDLVPDELPGNLIQVGNQFRHPESCEYLDTLYFNNGVPSGEVPTSGPNAVPPSQIATLNCQDPAGQPILVRGKKLTSVPHLTFYHKVELYPHPNADGTEPSNSTTGFPPPGYKTKTTWYLPDANDITLSALRDTINFKKGTRGDYTYKIWTGQPGSNQFFTQKEADTPYSFVFDNKNGYIYLYGRDDQSGWDIDATGANHSIFISLIRYEGSKGASGSGGAGGSFQDGLDASFNNVDISNNLNIIHNDSYSIETGILQSKKMLFPLPLTATSHEKSVIIATVSGDDDEYLNATGYFTVEVHDANYSEYNTKIHFIAGIITKEDTNSNYNSPPPPTPLVNDNSSSSNDNNGQTITTQNVAVDPVQQPVQQQLSVQPQQETIYIEQPVVLQPITINPITTDPITINPIIDPVPPGVSPTVDSDDDEGGSGTVTINQGTTSTSTPTNIEYSGFIKVLSCERQHYNVGSNFGIEYIQLFKEIHSNTCHVVLKLDALSVLPSNAQNSIIFNVRLYKNSLNIMDDLNKLQWTLENARRFSQGELLQNFITIKSLYVAGVPDNPSLSQPLYPNFPTESFNATTQYTVIDNSVNIEKELYIKGDINMVKNNDLNLLENNKIKSIVNNLYESKIFDNNDFSSTNITNGVWQTIATIEAQSALSALTDQRSAYAMFEVVDRSNAGTQYKFTENISFIVNFMALSSGSAHANITLLSKNPTKNASGDTGYIDQIRVLCGRHNSTTPSASNGGANIQLYRISNNTGVGNTDIRVSMYNNYKGLNTKQEMNPFVLTSSGLSMTSSTRSATINVLNSSFGFASTNNNTVSFQEVNISNLNATNIEIGGYLDMNGNELRGLNGLTLNGNLDMNGYNILENTVITSGNTASSLPRISQGTTDIDILVDNEVNPVITIGSGAANGQSHQIYFNCGAEINLDMNDIEIKNTDQITQIMSTHKEKTNRAYVQQFSFNTGTLPSTTRSDNLQPPWEIGGAAGDGDWITIAVTGSFIKDANASNPYIGDGTNKWRVNSKNFFRANALFELIDRTSGHHHNIKFYAGFKFGKPSIRILNNNTYSNIRFGAIRIVYGAGTAQGSYPKNTYTGCVLQFQLVQSTGQLASSANIEMNVWQNTENSGWKISKESVIIKENNPRCYVPTGVAQEFRKFDPMPNPAPIYSGPNGDGNYIPVGGSPYQYNLTIDTSTSLSLDSNYSVIYNNITAKNNILVDNILRLKTDTTSNINSTLNPSNNQPPSGSIAYDSELNSLIARPVSSGVGNGTNPFILGCASTVTLWDWSSIFQNNGYSSSYSVGQFRYLDASWPTHNIGLNQFRGYSRTGTGMNLPDWKPYHDGYITGGDFGFTARQRNNLTIFKVNRNVNTTGPASTLELWMRRNSNSLNDQSVGIIFEGPSITTGGGAANNNSGTATRWQIQVKDGAYASFSKDDTIYFFIKWVRNHTSGSDTIDVDVGQFVATQGNNSGSNLTSGATGANIHLNMIYLPQHITS